MFEETLVTNTRQNLFLQWMMAVAALLAVVACSPNVKEKKFDEPKTNFDPRYEDTDVQNGSQLSFDFNRIASMDGFYSPAVMHRLTENLLSISELTGQTEFDQVAKRLWRKTQDLPGARNFVPVKSSPFAVLAIAQTEAPIQEELVLIDQKVRSGIAVIQSSLKTVVSQHPWPKGPQEVDVAAGFIAQFLEKFSTDLSAREIYQPLKDALITELATQKEWVQNLGKKLADSVQNLKKLGDLIHVLEDTIEKEKIDVPDNLKLTLTQGKEIAKGLESCNSAQGALAVIVDVWNLLDEQQRETFIKPVNKDLYKLLHGKSRKDLQCLKKSDCNGFLRDLVKQFFILPKLEAYGVAKICSELNDQSLQFSVRTLKEMAPSLFAEVPTLTEEAVLKAIQEKRQHLADIKNNYAEFFQEKFQTWGTAQLPGLGSTYGFNSGKMEVHLRNREMRMTLQKDSVTTPENVGTGLAAMAGLLNTDSQPMYGQQMGMDAVNQLLAMIGYADRNKKLMPALMMPLEESAPLLDVNQFSSSKDSYAMPDKVYLGTEFQSTLQRPEVIDLSALQQAELLNGIGHMMAYFRDWQTTAYESNLGIVKAKDLVPEFDLEALNKNVFPKSDLFALSIANAAVILKNIAKNFSQVFVVGLNNQITWVNEYDFQGGDTAVMAGVVDIVAGKRQSVVQSENVSRWMLAISQFLKASEGIEGTRSEILLKPDAQGVRPLDTLLDARKQLRLLLIGMSNFLSNQLVAKDGLVVKSMKLSDMQIESDVEKTVLDQALAIRALLTVADVTKVSLYRVSAIEIYYKMNLYLYNPKIRFYSVAPQSKAIPLPLAMEIVRSLSQLKPHLPPQSQKQLSWILEPWFMGMRSLF